MEGRQMGTKDSDVCPLCRAVPLKELRAHLGDCEVISRLPVGTREAAGREVRALVLERRVLLRGLRRLSGVNERLPSFLGFDGTHSYCEDWSEAPWWAEQKFGWAALRFGSDRIATSPRQETGDWNAMTGETASLAARVIRCGRSKG